MPIQLYSCCVVYIFLCQQRPSNTARLFPMRRKMLALNVTQFPVALLSEKVAVIPTNFWTQLGEATEGCRVSIPLLALTVAPFKALFVLVPLGLLHLPERKGCMHFAPLQFPLLAWDFIALAMLQAGCWHKLVQMRTEHFIWSTKGQEKKLTKSWKWLHFSFSFDPFWSFP